MIDTGQVYANWLPIEPSISEKTIGKWMKVRGNRHKIFTKLDSGNLTFSEKH